MKILFINKFMYEKGGAEIYMKRLADALMSNGHTVRFFGMYSPENTMTNDLNLSVTPTDFHTNSLLEALSYPPRIIYSAEAKRKCRQVIEDFTPDIIHINNFNFQLTPSILDAIPATIPVIMTAHDAQLMCPNHLMYIPSKQKTCTKCLTSNHTFNCILNRCTHNSLPKSIISATEGALYRLVKTYDKIDKIVVPSRFLQKKYEEDRRFQGKTVFLSNFVDTADVSHINRPSNPNGILFFGRLSPEKGIKNFCDAAKALPDEKFIVCGDGPERSLVESVKNIEYKGFQKGDDLKRIIASSKLVVIPSICYENCPLSVIEAQQLGVPVLVPSYGGAAEMTDSRKIEDESAGALVRAIKEVYFDEGILEEMSKDSLRHISDYPDPKTYANEVEVIYRSVL